MMAQDQKTQNNIANGGAPIKQGTIDTDFLTGPGEMLVLNTLMQMAKVPGFVRIFGPYKKPTGKVGDDSMRWADYQRSDWSMRQLPTINVFESQSEEKDAENGFLSGTVSFQIFWPASFRREDSRRVESAFKGVMQNFFASDLVKTMLDELYSIQRPEKVYGLNEYGKNITWTPNAEGVVEDQLVPVTILDARYRIDLRAWYRALEFMSRTKGDPFNATLKDLTVIGGEYDGIVDAVTNVEVIVEDNLDVNTP
jgi:hypothetical protein